MGKGAGCTPSSLKKKPPTHDEGQPGGETLAAPVEAAVPTEPAPPPKKVEALKAAEPPVAPEVVPLEATAPVQGDAAAAAVEPVAAPEARETEAVLDVASPPAPLAKIFIVYYSMYGHVAKLAAKLKEGADSVPGAEGILYQVPETLPENILAKMGAPPKPSDIPIIEVKDLIEADAIIFGFPTRFGMMCGQMKQFWDMTGGLWKSQALAGKPAGFFFSTGTQGGGQETTALTAISQLCHHGMLFVPIGYTFAGINDPETHGGSPYGAGTYAGDGARQPLEVELEMAVHQGKITAAFAAKLKKGLAP